MSKLSKTKIALTPLSVEPLEGEWFRFHVGSRSTPGRKHLVDLEENNGNGRCNCIHFECHCQPQLRRGALPCNGLRCAHIRRARDYFLDEILPKLAKALTRRNS